MSSSRVVRARAWYHRVGRTTPLIDAVVGFVFMAVGLIALDALEGKSVHAGFDIGIAASAAVGVWIGQRFVRPLQRRRAAKRAAR